jgi:hypothetical protein
MKRLRALLATGALAMGSLLCAPSAHADDSVSEADRLFREGRAFSDAGDFEQALARFRASRTLKSTPKVWLNIIYMLFDLELYIDAVNEYDGLMAVHGAAVSRRSHAQLEPYLLRIGRVMGFGLLSIKTANSGPIYLDGKRLGKQAPGVPWRVTAGKHVVRVEAPGMATVECEVDVKAGVVSHLAIQQRRLISVEFGAGMLFGSSLGTNLETSRQERSSALGFVLDARVTRPLHGAIGWDAGLSYVQAHAATFPVTWDENDSGNNATWRMRHELGLYGAVMHGGIHARHRLTPLVHLGARLGIGAFLGAYRESGEGTVLKDGVMDGAPATIVSGSQFAFAPVVLPEVGLSFQFRSVRLGVSLAAVIVPAGSLSPPGTGVPYGQANPCSGGDENGSCNTADQSLDSIVGTRRIEFLLLAMPALRLGAQF